MIHLEIPFEPVSWLAPKYSKGRVYDPREKDKRAARFIIRSQYGGPVLTCPVEIQFYFYFPIPKSFSKKKIATANDTHFPTRCDTTNLVKLYEDCLKGIVIKDDRQVWHIGASKHYGDKGRVAISIREKGP